MPVLIDSCRWRYFDENFAGEKSLVRGYIPHGAPGAFLVRHWGIRVRCGNYFPEPGIELLIYAGRYRLQQDPEHSVGMFHR
ncbi:hypothetical protein P5V97_24385 [Mycobacteroides abscessus subsp. massiliense]|uniref:hypothetical protein n=1 Tax=Mycobacteroides abscessus TaxID=36809 RepID=UPI00266D1505|nr:hypothetical protein [Mycobacteroides abscessus]MDO2992627.1 hypothetical protein [Mycobacteroides abscessus subsp. massiliense]